MVSMKQMNIESIRWHPLVILIKTHNQIFTF